MGLSVAVRPFLGLVSRASGNAESNGVPAAGSDADPLQGTPERLVTTAQVPEWIQRQGLVSTRAGDPGQPHQLLTASLGW